MFCFGCEVFDRTCKHCWDGVVPAGKTTSAQFELYKQTQNGWMPTAMQQKMSTGESMFKVAISGPAARVASAQSWFATVTRSESGWMPKAAQQKITTNWHIFNDSVVLCNNLTCLPHQSGKSAVAKAKHLPTL